MGWDEPRPVLSNTEAMEHVHQLCVYANDSLESSEDESAESPPSSSLSSRRSRIASRVKCHHRFSSRNETAEKTQGQQSQRQVAAEVQMHDLVLQVHQKPQQ